MNSAVVVPTEVTMDAGSITIVVKCVTGSVTTSVTCSVTSVVDMAVVCATVVKIRAHNFH